MLSFRTIYTVFATNPCGDGGFLRREVAKLLDEQRELSRLKIRIRGLVDLANTQTANAVVLEAFAEVAGNMGGKALPAAVQIEIAQARDTAASGRKGKTRCPRGSFAWQVQREVRGRLSSLPPLALSSPRSGGE